MEMDAVLLEERQEQLRLQLELDQLSQVIIVPWQSRCHAVTLVACLGDLYVRSTTFAFIIILFPCLFVRRLSRLFFIFLNPLAFLPRTSHSSKRCDFQPSQVAAECATTVPRGEYELVREAKIAAELRVLQLELELEHLRSKPQLDEEAQAELQELLLTAQDSLADANAAILHLQEERDALKVEVATQAVALSRASEVDPTHLTEVIRHGFHLTPSQRVLLHTTHTHHPPSSSFPISRKCIQCEIHRINLSHFSPRTLTRSHMPFNFFSRKSRNFAKTMRG